MNYCEIAKYYDEKFLKYGPTHLGVDWPNEKDVEIRNEVMLQILDFADRKEKVSILDFGCGTASLYETIKKQKKNNIIYSGLDINKSFYDFCKNKYQDLEFYNQDINIDSNIPPHDFIIANGVFTVKHTLSQDEMMFFFTSTIEKLWKKTNKGLSFNLMSKHVDWEREDLFHVSLDDLCWFLKRKISRNFIIRNDYGLYEFTTYVYKK